MKLSTKGRYGIRAMYDLACMYGNGPQTVKAISERQNIPAAYLEQLIGGLRKGGLVESTRGAQGGYMLTKAPGEITIGSIIHATEGPLELAECVIGEKCDHEDGCAMHILWNYIYEGVNELLENMTLGEMLSRSNVDATRACKF